MNDSARSLVLLARRFPSTSSLVTEPWDPERLDDIGHELWRSLSESALPIDSEEPLPHLLIVLDTIRCLLYLHDKHRSWQSGPFDRDRVVERVWDQAHRDAFEEFMQRYP